MAEQRSQEIGASPDECQYHLDNAGSTCTGCGEPISVHGNTAYSFKYCSFPNCGCDGARLCMAGEASESAMSGNVEGMWSGKTIEQRKAVFDLMESISKERAK